MNAYPMILRCRELQQGDPPPVNLEAEGLQNVGDAVYHTRATFEGPSDRGFEGVEQNIMGVGVDDALTKALGLSLDG